MSSRRTRCRSALPRLSAENAQGELYLPQVLDILTAGGEPVAVHQLPEISLVLGVNDRVALAQVRKLAQQAIHERHMRAGVSIVDPPATVIDVDVEIGEDTVIEPFTTIRGETTIGSDCTIRHSYIIDSVIEDGVSVGPFAYLRPGTSLRKGSKIGDVRGGEELRHRPRREGSAPVLHRRCGCGRGDQSGREHDHRQL